MADYPSSIWTPTNPNASDIDIGHAAQHTSANNEIAAIETELGTNLKGTYVDVKTRLDALEAVIQRGTGDITDQSITGLGTSWYNIPNSISPTWIAAGTVLNAMAVATLYAGGGSASYGYFRLNLTNLTDATYQYSKEEIMHQHGTAYISNNCATMLKSDFVLIPGKQYTISIDVKQSPTQDATITGQHLSAKE